MVSSQYNSKKVNSLKSSRMKPEGFYTGFSYLYPSLFNKSIFYMRKESLQRCKKVPKLKRKAFNVVESFQN